MRRLELDFANTGPRTPVWAWALLGVALLAWAFIAWLGSAMKAEISTLSAQQLPAEGAESLNTRRQLDAGQQAQLARDVAQVNQVVASLNLPWATLFARLEGLKAPQVSLLSVQPEAAAARRMRIVGEARRLEDALAYVAQAAATPGFANVHLVSHEALADATRPGLRFALTLDWVGQP